MEERREISIDSVVPSAGFDADIAARARPAVYTLGEDYENDCELFGSELANYVRDNGLRVPGKIVRPRIESSAFTIVGGGPDVEGDWFAAEERAGR